MYDIPTKNLREISGFTETPEGWSNATIEELCQIGRGRVISGNEINANPGGYPVYSSQTRDQGRMGSIASYDFDGEFVTWTTDGENAGTVFYREGKFNCTNVCGTLFPKNKDVIDLKFLTYQLGEVAKSYVSYIGNPKLMNGVMGQVALIIPEKLAQQKIAHILTTVDNLIEKTQALIDKYTAVKQGMMHDLFTRGIDLATGQLRPSYEQAPELYKETELGWVPREWGVVPLSEYGAWQGGMTPSKSVNSYWQQGKHLWISPKDVRGEDLFDSEDKLTDMALSHTPLKLFQAGSILVVFRSGILRNKIPVSTVSKPFTVNQDIKVLEAGKDFDSNFCFYLLKSREQDILRIHVKSGTTVESIDGGSFFKMPCPKPSLNEQIVISRMLMSLEKKIQSELMMVEKAALQKKGLMQDLLTGRVRVN